MFSFVDAYTIASEVTYLNISELLHLTLQSQYNTENNYLAE